MKWILAFVISLFAMVVNGQELKVEREFRVKEEIVPKKSREWLNATFPNPKRLKWYFEKSKESETFEAKFKQNKSRYSVEFNKEGLIEDVEIDTKLKELDTPIADAICSTLSAFGKFRVLKVQEQWTAISSDLLQQALLETNKSLATIRYEIEFMAVIDDIDGLWEGLFDTNGTLLERRRIELRPTDNLNF